VHRRARRCSAGVEARAPVARQRETGADQRFREALGVRHREPRRGRHEATAQREEREIGPLALRRGDSFMDG